MSEQIGRLALRREGDLWNAYYAMPTTMDGAVFLASIRMGAVVDKPNIKAGFMALMQAVVADIIKDKIGVDIDWPTGPRAAPESERSGHG